MKILAAICILLSLSSCIVVDDCYYPSRYYHGCEPVHVDYYHSHGCDSYREVYVEEYYCD